MSKRATIALTLAALLFTACSDAGPTDDPRNAQIADLTRAVEDLTAANEELGQELRRQGRQLAGLSRVRVGRNGSTNCPRGARPAGSNATAADSSRA